MKHIAVLLLFSVASLCQQIPHPLTHVDACSKFSNAIVQVDTSLGVHGSGFIVDPNGWIITAAHVVIDSQTKTKASDISVVLWDKTQLIAHEVLPITDLFLIRDFAILKVGTSRKLPFLELGNEDDARIGSNLTIIGFPLSAMFRSPVQPVPKFCMIGTLVANSSFTFQGNMSIPFTSKVYL